jgi:hypothetical protein
VALSTCCGTDDGADVENHDNFFLTEFAKKLKYELHLQPRPHPAEQAKVAKMFPVVSKFVQNCGFIEIGDLDGCGFIVTAEDFDGVRVFEDDNLSTLVEALAALEKELTMWFSEKESQLLSVTKKSARCRRNN